jgi:hypothetical protein
MRLSTKEDLIARILAKVLVINPISHVLINSRQLLRYYNGLHPFPNLLNAAF